jgi:hypothetical protein
VTNAKYVYRSHSSSGGGGGGFLHPTTAAANSSSSNGYALNKSTSSNSLHENADNMLKDLEGSLKASTNYIESHRSYSGPTGTQEYHEVRSYSSGGGAGDQPHSAATVPINDDFNLERQVQHMMPSSSVATNGSSSSQLQSANMVSSVQQNKSYTTYKVQTNQYGNSGERIASGDQQERPGSRLKQNIDELDTLLYDLNNARKMSSDAGGDYTASSITPGNMSSDDYSFNDSAHLQDHVKKTVHSYNAYNYQTDQSGPSGKPPSPSPRRRTTGGPSQSLSSPSAVRKLSPSPSRRHQEQSSLMSSTSNYNYSSSQQQQQQQQQQQRETTTTSTAYPERPLNSDGTPTGVSYYTKYHSNHSHQSQGAGPVAFPTKDTPRMGGRTQAPPKRVDELMTELSEFDSSIQHTGFVEPVEPAPQQKYREPSPEPYRPYREPSPLRPSKTQSTPGPAVYYPSSDRSDKSRTDTTTVHHSGTDAGPVVVHHSLSEGSGKGRGRDKSRDKHEESEGKQGAAVIPICLPLCCAAPCVIM